MQLIRGLPSTAACFLALVSSLLALTPDEADRAIQKGLEATSVQRAKRLFQIGGISSRQAEVQRALMGVGSGHEYTLYLRSCRQLLQFAAFQSKTDSSIDLDELRSSCLGQDRVWIAVDEGEPNAISGGLLKKLLGKPERLQALTHIADLEVTLDGGKVDALGETQLEELGPTSWALVFAAEAFQKAEQGRLTVTFAGGQQVIIELGSQLLRRLFQE